MGASDWITGLVGGGGLAGALTAAGIIVKALIQKKTVNADAAARLARAGLDVAEEVREDATAEIRRARQEAQEQIRAFTEQAAERLSQALQDVSLARREASEARARADEAERRASQAEHTVRILSREAWLPTATVERWRELVSGPPVAAIVNGSPVG